MKKLVFLTISSLLILGCGSDNNNSVNCNFLLDLGVNLNVDLNLPEFSQLQFTGNSVRVEGQGNGGIILHRRNSSTLLAWDGADPAHGFSNCSLLQVSGPIATCSCEDANQYNLLSGQVIGEADVPCTLIRYTVDDLGNNQFFISN